jgi:NADH pyrophosphatase NudC (nudix superfamily)
VLVAPFSGEDQARIAALNAGDRAMSASDAPSAAQVQHHLQTAAALASGVAPAGAGAAADARALGTAPRRYCSACGTEAAPGARFCSHCAAPLGN